jgi:hypothetical protein
MHMLSAGFRELELEAEGSAAVSYAYKLLNEEKMRLLVREDRASLEERPGPSGVPRPRESTILCLMACVNDVVAFIPVVRQKHDTAVRAQGTFAEAIAQNPGLATEEKHKAFVEMRGNRPRLDVVGSYGGSRLSSRPASCAARQG